MKQIGADIIARMLYDYLKCEPLAIKAIPGFNINSVSYEMPGPVFDNAYELMYFLSYLILLICSFFLAKGLILIKVLNCVLYPA